MDNFNSSSMEDDRLLSHFGVTSMNTLYCNLYLRLFKIHSWQNAERRTLFTTCGPRTTSGPQPCAWWSASKPKKYQKEKCLKFFEFLSFQAPKN